MVRTAVLVFALVLSACSTAPVDPSEAPTPISSLTQTPLPSASSVPTTGEWTEPADYSFTIDSQCGERALIGRFRVEVENRAVVSVEGFDEQGRSVAAIIEPEAVPTLAEMFERVAEARRDNASEVILSTDPADGHPVSVKIDWQANMIDEEECYEISDFASASG